MDFNYLSQKYWDSQLERLEKARTALAARDSVAIPGRIVPGSEDLVFGTGRRIRAAVLFLDISGFSGRASETQEEQDMILRMLTFFFTEMVRVAEEHGGTVEKNTGDGLMAYFEESAAEPPGGSQRAVACALTMFYVTAHAINPVLLASRMAPLSFRIGIDSGWITIAKLGAARRFGSLAAVGTTANLASKLLGLAGPGDLVLGDIAKCRLPIDWQLRFCLRLPKPSGWIYRADGQEYPCYLYSGRWTGPR